jgi:hypothetical protein
LPPGVLELLKSNPAFGDVVSWSAEPEAQVRFDGFRGEPRNCDLLVQATDAFGDFVIAVEAKADEPFGDTIDDAMSAALERLVANPSSKGVARITNLAQSLFRERRGAHAKIATLRYQLLTATAGALAASTAGRRTVMLVQEFRTGKTAADKLQLNAKDLDAFVNRLTDGAIEHCEPGQLYGPIAISRRTDKQDSEVAPPLFIGKVVHDRTMITADEAVRVALDALGGDRTIAEVAGWVEGNLTQRWKDIGTTMADMTLSPHSRTGYPAERQILERVEAGMYRLKDSRS